MTSSLGRRAVSRLCVHRPPRHPLPDERKPQDALQSSTTRTSLVFDLDPGEGAGMLDCGEIALLLKKLFETWGLQSFVEVSVSKGLHLSVPLNRDTPYEVTQPFAKPLRS